MNDAERRQVVMAHEGQIIQCAGHHGAEHAAAVARCVIDGAFNALLRIEGAQDATKFAFNVTDRLVLAVKEPTPWTPTPAIEAAAIPEPEPPAAEPLKPDLWTVIAAAILHCLPR